MTIDCCTTRFVADLVKLITECTHFGGVVLIPGNDLVNRIDDDGVVALISNFSNESRDKFVERHRAATKVPNHDVMTAFRFDLECFVDLGKTIDATGRIDFKVNIQNF